MKKKKLDIISTSDKNFFLIEQFIKNLSVIASKTEIFFDLTLVDGIQIFGEKERQKYNVDTPLLSVKTLNPGKKTSQWECYVLALESIKSGDRYILIAPDMSLNIEKFNEFIRLSDNHDVVLSNRVKRAGISTYKRVTSIAFLGLANLLLPFHLKDINLTMLLITEKARRALLTPPFLCPSRGLYLVQKFYKNIVYVPIETYETYNRRSHYSILLSISLGLGYLLTILLFNFWFTINKIKKFGGH